MGDFIALTARSTRINLTAGTTVYQPIDQALDISAYDQIDLVVNLYKAVGTLTVDFLTHVQNTAADEPQGWGKISVGTLAAIAEGTYQTISLPTVASTNPLLKFLRYSVQGNTTGIYAFEISGIFRRKSL